MNQGKKLKVLLTGASGTVGSEVMKFLTQHEDVELTVFDVKSKKSKKIFKPYFNLMRLIYGDITNKNQVTVVAKNQDVVIHLAAIIPPLADENPVLAHKVNVEGTQNLIAALEEESPDAFFMFSSSVSVYGDRLENPDIKIGDPLTPSAYDEYAVTKIKCEKLIQESKLSWTIFRLGAIMKNHKISKLMFHMPLETVMEITTAEDAGRAFANGVWKKDELENRIFNLGGGSECTLSYKDFLEKSFELYGLGALDFDPHAFATHNFHCGRYSDGDELENIVHFRKDNLESYFAKAEKDISPVTKFLASVFKSPIKKYLQRQSEPLHAHLQNDEKAKQRFFKTANQ